MPPLTWTCVMKPKGSLRSDETEESLTDAELQAVMRESQAERQRIQREAEERRELPMIHV